MKQIFKKGNIVVCEEYTFTWIVRIVDYDAKTKKAKVTQGIDVKPILRLYHCGDFNSIWEENIYKEVKYRLATMEEIKLYNVYTRELRILGTNLTNFGEKLWKNIPLKKK